MYEYIYDVRNSKKRNETKVIRNMETINNLVRNKGHYS